MMNTPPPPQPGELNPEGRLAVVRWLMDPVAKLPLAVRVCLFRDIDVSAAGILAAALNYSALNVICCVLGHNALFWYFLAGTFILAAARCAILAAMRRQKAQCPALFTDIYVLATLAWCLWAGLLCGAALASGIGTLQVLASAAALAPQGILGARNYPAPRFAAAILCTLDLPFVAGSLFAHDAWLIGLVVFTPAYLFANVAMIRRFHKAMIGTYTARFSSLDEARRDPLTGVFNRLGLAEMVAREPELLRQPTALFYMDLDGFKQVNDRHGHPAGDALLKLVTERLSAVARKGDCLARLGGDEFALLARAATAEQCELLARRLVESVASNPFTLQGGIIARVGLSLGYACAPQDGTALEELSRQADMALYAVKQNGKGTWRRACAA
jgi:diguanylate cyclase (GGDEF)-like protein